MEATDIISGEESRTSVLGIQTRLQAQEFELISAIHLMMPSIASIINFFVAFAVLPSTLYPLQGQKLHIRYPGGKWVKPGATIDIEGRLPLRQYRLYTLTNQ